MVCIVCLSCVLRWPPSIHLSFPILLPRIAPSLNSPVFPPPSSTMTTSLPPPESRGVDYSLLTCGETKCSGHGACKVPLGGSVGFVCDCDLGYRGQFCENTVNGALSVTLTLSVLALLIGGLIVAFILAKMKQKHKKRKRY